MSVTIGGVRVGGYSPGGFTGGSVANTILAPDGTEANPPYSFTNFTGHGMRPVSAGQMTFGVLGVDRLALTVSGGQTILTLGRNNGPSWHRNTGMGFQPAEFFGWTPSTNQAATSSDVRMYRVAAGIIGMYNSTTAHELQVYSNRTDASNYARLAIRTAAGDYTISPEAAGSGTLRALNVKNLKELHVLATPTGDTAPNDDTTLKKITLQKLAAPPTNGTYWAASNNPGTDVFYLVMEEG